MHGAPLPRPARDPHRYVLTYATFGRTPVFDDPEAIRLVRTQFLKAASRHGVEIVAYGFLPEHAHVMAEGAGDARALVAALRHHSASSYRARTGRTLWQRGLVMRGLDDADAARASARGLLEMPHSGSFAWDRLALLLNPKS